MEKLLKADQFRWLKSTVQQKIDLRRQADGLVSTLDGLLKMIEEESKANGGKMTKRRAMQLQIFRALREDLEPLVRDRAAAAEEAKKIAWLAAARANGDVSEQEMRAVEEELDAIGEAWRAKSGSLKERMRGASSARQKALSQQMAYLGTSLFSVFGKVGDLISVPPCAS